MKSEEDKSVSHPKKRVRIDDRSYNHPPGVRRSPRINPHLFEANKLLSLQTIIAENVIDAEIKGEIFSMQIMLKEVGNDDDHFKHPMAYIKPAPTPTPCICIKH